MSNEPFASGSITAIPIKSNWWDNGNRLKTLVAVGTLLVIGMSFLGSYVGKRVADAATESRLSVLEKALEADHARRDLNEQRYLTKSEFESVLTANLKGITHTQDEQTKTLQRIEENQYRRAR